MAYTYKDLNTNISLIDFVIFDLETTGLNFSTDKIIEIGAIKIRDRKIIGTFSELINPQTKISSKSVELTGITDEMVKDKDTVDKVLVEFLKFIDNSVLVGHNIKNFDLPFLKKVASDYNFPNIENQVVDTLTLARAKFSKLKSHRLQDLVEHFKFEKNNAHRALDDCYSSMRLLYTCALEGAIMEETPALREIMY